MNRRVVVIWCGLIAVLTVVAIVLRMGAGAPDHGAAWEQVRARAAALGLRVKDSTFRGELQSGGVGVRYIIAREEPPNENYLWPTDLSLPAWEGVAVVYVPVQPGLLRAPNFDGDDPRVRLLPGNILIVGDREIVKLLAGE
jgi:hypothetical protein